MNRLFAKASLCRTAAVALFTASTLILTGCGLGTAAAPESSVIPALSGHAIGGNTPIAGATVKLYATGTAYGTGSFLKEANTVGIAGQDTDSNGFFSFASGYTCPAGQFAYVTLAGGTTGSNTANNNLVLVAALGRCEDIATHTFTDINELSTIAAAYALGHFSSIVSGTGANTVVGIGAPATNRAVTGCVANGTTCTSTAAAGLGHAFLNAANLVDVSNGVALATLPGNAVATVPQALINSLGNVLVACVNSSGGSAGDGTTACGSIFTATTLNSVAPVNTFSAMVNLAANPTLGGSAAAVANFLGYATPATTIYSPALTAATGLNDFSIAINYPAGLGAAAGVQGLAFPVSGAVDINDVFYVGNTVSSGTAPTNVLSFSSNGNLLSATANNTNLKNALGLSVDALGNGYFVTGGGSSANALGFFTSSAGVVSATPTVVNVGTVKCYYTATDRANNVWTLCANTATNNTLFMAPASATPTFTGQAAIAVTIPASNFVGLAVDPDQNIWTTNSTNLSVLQNTGTLASPTYSSSSVVTTTTTGSPADGIAFAGSPYVGYISSYQVSAVNPGIQPFTPTLSAAGAGPEVTALNAGTLTTAGSKITGSYTNEADGAGAIWIVDNNSKSIINYNTTAGTGYRYIPCLVTAGVCGTIFGASGKPTSLSIDSTGSIWVVAPAGGNALEIIGAAAPTWPLLSLGNTGTP